MQEVEALCDRVLMMRSGRLVLDESVSNVRNSNQLSLETSLTREQVAALAGSIEGLELLEASPDNPQDSNQYLFSIDESKNFNRVSAAVSRAVLAEGGDLYAISRARRDLEALFRQIAEVPEATQQAEDATHAA